MRPSSLKIDRDYLYDGRFIVKFVGRHNNRIHGCVDYMFRTKKQLGGFKPNYILDLDKDEICNYIEPITNKALAKLL